MAPLSSFLRRFSTTIQGTLTVDLLTVVDFNFDLLLVSTSM
jgi:hypothetical protein